MIYTYELFQEGIEYIYSQITYTAKKYDYIIGIARGGLIPATVLSYKLDVPMIPIEWSTRGPGRQWLPEYTKKELDGKKVLFVDDIIDSGKTIEDMEIELPKLDFDVAALVFNVDQSVNCDYWHLTIKRSINNDWIYFWWDPKK